VGARFSAPVQTGPDPASCTMGTVSFPGVKSGRSLKLTPHPFSCRAQERVELYLYTPMGRTACTEPLCLYNVAPLPLPITFLPLWTVQSVQNLCLYKGAPLPLPIPLLPLWAVQPVQSLIACTTVHFTFSYTSTPPMDRTACTEPQCLYNGALYLSFRVNLGVTPQFMQLSL
jgi:hypothetical protein